MSPYPHSAMLGTETHNSRGMLHRSAFLTKFYSNVLVLTFGVIGCEMIIVGVLNPTSSTVSRILKVGVFIIPVSSGDFSSF